MGAQRAANTHQFCMQIYENSIGEKNLGEWTVFHSHWNNIHHPELDITVTQGRAGDSLNGTYTKYPALQINLRPYSKKQNKTIYTETVIEKNKKNPTSTDIAVGALFNHVITDCCPSVAM